MGLIGKTLIFVSDLQQRRHEIVAVSYNEQAETIAFTLLLLRTDGVLITHPLETRGENADVWVVS